MPPKGTPRFSPHKAVERRSSVSVAGSLGLQQGNTVSSPVRGSRTGGLPSRGRGEVEALFDRLKQADREVQGDIVGPNGLLLLFKELSVTPDTIEMYTLLWRLGATKNSTLTHAEWLLCMYVYTIDTPGQLRSRLGEWVADVKTKQSSFLAMYYFLYDFIRGENFRQMIPQVAVKAWEVFFKDVAVLQTWAEWVSSYEGEITRGVWRELPLFFSTVKTPESYDSTERWSCIFDDFVEHWKLKQ